MLVHEHVSGGGLAGDVPASWLVEGSAMRRALAGDLAEAGARTMTTVDARLADEPGPWQPIRIEAGSATELIVDLARRVDLIILIAPETGGILRELARSVAEAGGASLGCTPDAIDLAADKLRVAVHFGRVGVPTPEVRLAHPKAGLPGEFPYPAVLKPIDGAGSLDTLLVGGPADAVARSFPHERGLLQPFVSGEPRSACFLARPGAPPILLSVARQWMSLDRGRFAYQGGTILLDDLPSDHPARLAASSMPGLGGLFGIDYIDDPRTGRVEVLEINPRPTTSCVGLVAALGPGRLGAALLGLGRSASPRDSISGPRPTRSLTFRADGTIAPRASRGLVHRASR